MRTNLHTTNRKEQLPRTTRFPITSPNSRDATRKKAAQLPTSQRRQKSAHFRTRHLQEKFSTPFLHRTEVAKAHILREPATLPIKTVVISWFRPRVGLFCVAPGRLWWFARCITNSSGTFREPLSRCPDSCVGSSALCCRDSVFCKLQIRCDVVGRISKLHQSGKIATCLCWYF